MTTPRDAIGLSDRLRDVEAAERRVAGDCDCRPEDTANWQYADTCREAATALDALSTDNEHMAETILKLNEYLADANARALRAEQERDNLRSFAQELSDALLACRPLGGSELFVRRFGRNYADPVYCKAAIEQRIEAYHEAMKESVRNRKRAEKAEQERDEAYARLKPFADAAERASADIYFSIEDFITEEHLKAARELIRRLAAGTGDF